MKKIYLPVGESSLSERLVVREKLAGSIPHSEWNRSETYWYGVLVWSFDFKSSCFTMLRPPLLGIS